METTQKKCKRCDVIKDINEFNKCKTFLDGLQYICRECDNISTKKYKRTKKGLISKIYAQQRSSAKHRNMPLPTYINIELREWLLNQDLFHKLYDEWVYSNYNKKLTPSVDRKDDYISYTMNNIQLMTWRENEAKGYNDSKNGINTKQSRTVYQYSKDGKFLKEFYSLSEASRQTNAEISNICYCCTGKYKTAGGYIWKYTKI